jgi:hypothetical protein
MRGKRGELTVTFAMEKVRHVFDIFFVGAEQGAVKGRRSFPMGGRVALGQTLYDD